MVRWSKAREKQVVQDAWNNFHKVFRKIVFRVSSQSQDALKQLIQNLCAVDVDNPGLCPDSNTPFKVTGT